MQNKRRRLTIAFLIGLSLSGLQAQESIIATGGNALGVGGSVSFSVGLIAYQTFISTSGSVAQSLQHSYEIKEVTAIGEDRLSSLSVIAYPNPAADYIVLEVKDVDLNSFFKLFDMYGKLLITDQIKNTQTFIDMSDLVPASYLIKTGQKNKEVKTFKIIKN